jgi:hypothetical protein
LQANAGAILDPEVVTTFLEILRSEAALASDLPHEARHAVPLAGQGYDGVHAGLVDARDERPGNGAISEHGLNPAYSHYSAPSREGPPLFNGPLVPLPVQTT